MWELNWNKTHRFLLLYLCCNGHTPIYFVPASPCYCCSVSFPPWRRLKHATHIMHRSTFMNTHNGTKLASDFFIFLEIFCFSIKMFFIISHWRITIAPGILRGPIQYIFAAKWQKWRVRSYYTRHSKKKKVSMASKRPCHFLTKVADVVGEEHKGGKSLGVSDGTNGDKIQKTRQFLSLPSVAPLLLFVLGNTHTQLKTKS